MSDRPRHPRKELEAILTDAESRGWTVARGKKFKLYCPCPDKHMKTVALTPSNPNYVRELRRQLARATCWGQP